MEHQCILRYNWGSIFGTPGKDQRDIHLESGLGPIFGPPMSGTGFCPGIEILGIKSPEGEILCLFNLKLNMDRHTALHNPVRDLLEKTYRFASADLKHKVELFTQNINLQSFYITLLRNHDSWEHLKELYRASSPSIRKNIVPLLLPSEASLLVDILTSGKDREELINTAFNLFRKEFYAEFVVYIEDEHSRQMALEKAEDQKFILDWEP